MRHLDVARNAIVGEANFAFFFGVEGRETLEVAPSHFRGGGWGGEETILHGREH